MTGRWIEIPAPLGAALWNVLRADMHDGHTIGVHESFSDPNGEYGNPTMMTVVGHRSGAPLLRLETTWTAADRSDAVTRYWLPKEVSNG